MTRFVTFIGIIGLAFAAQAKDPHNQIADFSGKKVLKVKIGSSAYKSHAEVLYMGDLSLWLVDGNGVHEVRVPYLGSPDFEWTGAVG